MKNKLLKDLYDCFYIPPELPAPKQEIEECHQALIDALDKPERRLVLQIIDAKEDTSIDSFISGFDLAWKLSMELNTYENERSVSCRMAKKLGARFASQKFFFFLCRWCGFDCCFEFRNLRFYPSKRPRLNPRSRATWSMLRASAG